MLPIATESCSKCLSFIIFGDLVHAVDVPFQCVLYATVFVIHLIDTHELCPPSQILDHLETLC